jgi:hypothetical protein
MVRVRVTVDRVILIPLGDLEGGQTGRTSIATTPLDDQRVGWIEAEIEILQRLIETNVLKATSSRQWHTGLEVTYRHLR